MRAQVAFVLFVLSACGKVEGGGPDARPIDAPPGPDGPPAAHWTTLATVSATLDLGNNRGFMAVGLAGNLYFAPISDPPMVTTFLRYNLGGGGLSSRLALPPVVQNDFEASGYGAIFVGDDADAIYLVGDDAFRYTPSADTWTPIAGYGPGFVFHRGESAGAWENNNQVVFMVGGRDNSNTDQGTAIRLNPDGTWAMEPGALPYTVGNALAYAPPNDNKTYIAGGNTSDNNRRHLAVHATGTSGWTALADAPGDLSNAIGMGHHTSGGTTRVFVATQTSLFFYNPQTMTWDRTVAMPSTGRARVVMTRGKAYAIAQAGTNAEIFELIGID